MPGEDHGVLGDERAREVTMQNVEAWEGPHGKL